MRTGRVVIFTDPSNGTKAVGQVATINPEGGAEIKTSPDATPVFVPSFHKLRPFSLAFAVSELGATLSNDGITFPSGLKLSLDQVDSTVDIGSAVESFVGLPLGDESVPSPVTTSSEEDLNEGSEFGDGNDDEDLEVEDHDEEE